MSPSSKAIAALSGYWGITYQETVDLEIGASLDNSIWTGVLISASGKYSVQSRLYPGVSEVVSNTTSSNFCAQLADLKTLAKIPGLTINWFMLSAVVAHENVHVSRLYPCMQASLPTMQSLVRTLHVPFTGQTKAQAILQLKALDQFQNVKKSASEAWAFAADYLAGIDHSTGGECEIQEKAVITPVATAICSSASTSSWGACSNCPFSF